MKYIRTDDGIKKVFKKLKNELYLVKVSQFKYYHYYPDCKVADTIKELLDCYVLESKIDDDFDVLSKSEMERYFRFMPKDYNCYGAILVKGKGLIYVAKMKGVLPNGEIDWELL